MHEDIVAGLILLADEKKELSENERELIKKAADIIKNKKTSVKRQGKSEFVPPTLNEVIEYVKERNSTVDPVKFYDYFNVGNWIDSKGQPVKNWKQKLLTWEGRDGNGQKRFSPNAQNSAATGKTKSKFHYDNA